MKDGLRGHMSWISAPQPHDCFMSDTIKAELYEQVINVFFAGHFACDPLLPVRKHSSNQLDWQH